MNDMVRIGDWIEMPKFNADGDVIDIAVNTVKVQNWDKTITTIPTYMMVSDSFKNWRGMNDAGGRRIKRSIHIDITSVRFCTVADINRWKKIRILENYLTEKEFAIKKSNEEISIESMDDINSRKLTNIGTFRAYILNYLNQHPQIKKDMTLLVRQLSPTEIGIPIEVYAFSADQDWIRYEAIQSDIFDHLFAMLPEFDLRPYQLPGKNINAAIKNINPFDE
jgi:miniconductance mechanosensitive channel